VDFFGSKIVIGTPAVNHKRDRHEEQKVFVSPVFTSVIDFLDKSGIG
jgi:hypothetical protein